MFLAVFNPTDAFAQTVPKPSVPSFTVKQVNCSYDVPPVYQTNPYTGKTEMTQAGYHVTNRTIDIKIQNQPFSYSYNGTTYTLYFNVRVKGHYETNWTEVYPASQVQWCFTDTLQVTGPLQSDSEYTKILLPCPYSDGDTLDLQVQSMVGHESTVLIFSNVMSSEGSHYETINAFDLTSDWSSTQTIIIGTGAQSSLTASADPKTSTLPSQTPTTVPQPPVNSSSLFNLTIEQIALVIMAVVIAVLALSVVVIWRKITGKKIRSEN
jgi:hypothetical protein